MVDARCIADNERRTIIGFCFFQGFQELILIGTHSYLCDVDVSVLGFHHAQVFLLRLLTRSCELGNSCGRRCFGSLAARVGIYFRIEYEDVDILTLGQHVIQAAVTDIVSPAVAAEDTLAAFDEELLHSIDLFQSRFAFFFLFQQSDDGIGALTRTFAFQFMFFPVLECFLQLRAGNIHGIVNIFFEQFAFCLFCQHHAKAIFGIIFKEGRRPGRSMTLGILCIAAVRSTAAPYRGTAVSVSNHHAVAEELGNDFTVRRFCTTSAGTGKFKQRLFELAADDRVFLHGVLLLRQGNDIIPQGSFVFFVVERFHGQGFLRADMSTAAAAQAVHDGYDDVELIPRSHFDFFILIAFRCFGGFIRRQEERTDSGMRADEGTLVAANTFFGIPTRHEHSYATFFFCAGTSRPSAIFHTVICTDWQVVAFQGIDRNREFAEEFRVLRKINRFVLCISPFGRYIDLHNILQAFINCRIIHIDDFLAFLAIRFDDRFFQFINSQVYRNDFGQFEESRLHNHVDTAAETDLLGNTYGIDDVELYVIAGNIAF